MFLLTGGFGYIGMKLLQTLSKEFPGSGIRIIDDISRERSKYLPPIEDSGSSFDFVKGDIRDPYSLERSFKDVNILIDLAGITNAPISFERKDLTFSVNVDGVKNLVSFSRKHDLEYYIYSSSASVYGPTQGVVDESSECKPISPYGESKLLAEKELLDACNEFGLKVVIFRFGTVYGWSDGIRFDTVVNKFTLDSFEGKPLEVWRSAWNQKRPYLHIEDCSRAVSFAIENSKKMAGQVYNVVGQNAPVDGVILAVAKNFEYSTVHTVSDPNLNQVSYTVDDSKIRTLGFKTTGTIDEGVGDLSMNLKKQSNRIARSDQVGDSLQSTPLQNR